MADIHAIFSLRPSKLQNVINYFTSTLQRVTYFCLFSHQQHRNLSRSLSPTLSPSQLFPLVSLSPPFPSPLTPPVHSPLPRSAPSYLFLLLHVQLPPLTFLFPRFVHPPLLLGRRSPIWVMKWAHRTMRAVCSFRTFLLIDCLLDHCFFVFNH